MRAPALALLLLAAPLALAPRSASAEPRPADSVVAVLSSSRGGEARGRTIITLSDLELEARIAIIGRGGSGAAQGALPAETLAATLEWLLAQQLLFVEAEQLAVSAVEGAEVAEAVARFREKAGGADAYRDFLVQQELTELELARILRRGLAVSRYLDSRFKLAVAVSDEELQRGWEARREELGGRSLDDVRPAVRVLVEKEKREELVAALIADVRSRAEVRILHDLGGRRSAPPPRPQPAPAFRGSDDPGDDE